MAARPTCGYRRITALPDRPLRPQGLRPRTTGVNHKRAYRIVQADALRLARSHAERPARTQDGKIVVMRSKPRWCSDGFEVTCRNGGIVRGALDHRS